MARDVGTVGNVVTVLIHECHAAEGNGHALIAAARVSGKRVVIVIDTSEPTTAVGREGDHESHFLSFR